MVTKDDSLLSFLERLRLKFTWSFGHMVLQDHVTNWNYYVSPTKDPVAIKLEGMVAYFGQLLPIK